MKRSAPEEDTGVNNTNDTNGQPNNAIQIIGTNPQQTQNGNDQNATQESKFRRVDETNQQEQLRPMIPPINTVENTNPPTNATSTTDSTPTRFLPTISSPPTTSSNSANPLSNTVTLTSTPQPLSTPTTLPSVQVLNLASPPQSSTTSTSGPFSSLFPAQTPDHSKVLISKLIAQQIPPTQVQSHTNNSNSYLFNNNNAQPSPIAQASPQVKKPVTTATTTPPQPPYKFPPMESNQYFSPSASEPPMVTTPPIPMINPTPPPQSTPPQSTPPQSTAQKPKEPEENITRIAQVKFESALDFLDQVKLQFSNQPKVYNQFLDIMKDFKAQAIDTPGVIARVSELFKGHRNLILGFNTFLPPGYKIEYIPEENELRTTMPPQVVAQLAAAAAASGAPPPLATAAPTATATATAAAAGAPAGRKQPEFDHARNYVKKIKMRFALQPHIYKAFLEILHTYHKEQHTIKDVYDQVANLFQNHQDLLEEFAQFLPDPVAQANSNAPQQKQKKAGRKAKSEKEREIQMQQEKKPTREKPQVPVAPPPTAIPEDKHPNYEELQYFSRVKQRLSNQQQYYEFLKCLNLFSQGIVTRIELVLLVKDILGKHKDLFNWFKNFIGFDENSFEFIEKQQEEAEKPVMGATSTAEIDFKTCKRYGPSYRALPKNYIAPICSGRTELCMQVLNDIWVSVPTGSEDFVFKNQRKNQYEEMLFKCEDDRFELDLVIELNTSTIRALERVMRALSEINESQLSKFKLDPYLDVLQVRSIERIYGDKGPEVIEALYSNPQGTVPIILKRMKQKDQEWCRAKREWNKIWREVNEKNYYKSLDHQSYFFKQNDRKNLAPKVLLAEIKQKYQEQLRLRERMKRKQEAPKEESPVVNEEKMEVEQPGSAPTAAPTEKEPEAERTVSPWHLKFKMADKEVFTVVLSLVALCADRTIPKGDKEKIDTFFKHFVKVFFSLEDSVWDSGSVGQAPAESVPASTTETTATSTAPAPSSAPAPMEVETPVPTDKQSSSLFFGNNTFYVFFRLFQILYERIEKAKEMSKHPQSNSQFALLLNPNKDKKQLEQEKDKFQSFLKLTNGFILGAKEQSLFEDECRSLFGVSSFIFFTIDKLIVQLTKQLQQLLSEEQCSKLLALYSYECSRPSGPTESVYHSNCVEILEDQKCFKIQFEKSPHYGDFTLQLLDSVHNPPKFVEFSVENKHEKWSQYVDSFVGTEETNSVDAQKQHVYLLRNRKKTKEETALDNVNAHNGLECRICLSTYRLFYVEDTEDYLYRKGSIAKAHKFAAKRSAEQRTSRLTKIVDKISSKLPQQQPVATTEVVPEQKELAQQQ